MSRRAVLVLLVAACRADPTHMPMQDAAVALPSEPAVCGGGAAVVAQGALYDADYFAFGFDGAMAVVGERLEIVGATSRLTFFVESAVGEHMRVFTQITLGSETTATNLGHVIIDVNTPDCVAGRFDVALKGRVVGSFRTN